MRKLFSIAIFIWLITITTQAQVTIGSNLSPAKGALLDLKEFDSTVDDLATARKGLLLPRVALVARTELTPLFDALAIGTPDYETIQKPAHAGVIVYNVDNVGAEDLKKGLYAWDGNKWIPIGFDDKAPLDYTINCGAVVVNGNYLIDAPVGIAEYAELTLTTNDPKIIGNYYRINTGNPVNGLTFTGADEIRGGTQTIRLQAQGIPTQSGMYDFSLALNSSSNALCSFTVPVAFPRMKIAGFGFPAYSIASGTLAGSRRLASNANNFGIAANSTVKTQGFDFIHNDPLNTTTLNAVLAQKPDIIMTGYPIGFTAVLATTLKNYVDQGGVLITFAEDHSTTIHMVRAIYGGNVAITQSAGGTAGTIYTINGSNDDPIINGPFLNINGKPWGEDASTTVVINNLPPAESIIYSTNTNGQGATMFRHSTLNYMQIGDGGFKSYYNGGGGLADYTAYPFRIKADDTPDTKYFGLSAVRTDVYNSYIFANILAWAVDRAYHTGINRSTWGKP